jgi:hypothetical protein
LRITLLVALSAFFVIAAFILRTQVFMGGSPWWQETPWKQIIMFALMLLGMLVSVLNVAIKSRRDEQRRLAAAGKDAKIGLKIDKWDAFQPFLFSLVAFSVLHAQIGGGALSVANAALSFETGFLWQTIVDKQLEKPHGT